MFFRIESFREYGQPKLKKPKELAGIDVSFSVDYIHNKCKFQVFVLKDKDKIWIKARDWFSPQILGTDNNIKKKFIYSDNFGSIVLRNEAWVVYSNFFKTLQWYVDIRNWRQSSLWAPPELYLKDYMLRLIEKHYSWEEYSLDCSTMSRCFEKIVKEVMTVI